MNMLLEVNSRGSWARVGEFDDANLAFVQASVRRLQASLRLGDRTGPSWRVVKSGGGRSPKVIWRYQ